MIITKENVLKTYKTTPMEESLLVLQTDEFNREKYVEYAIVKLPSQPSEEELQNWLSQIDRFNDCYVYDAKNPVRLRLKKIPTNIEYLENQEIRNIEDLVVYMEGQRISFNVQKPPLYKLCVVKGDNSTYLCLAYHHLLFDGTSIQLALSVLSQNISLEFDDWAPNFSISGTKRKTIQPFNLEQFVPPPLKPLKEHLRISGRTAKLTYQQLMHRWVSFISESTGSEKVVVGEVISARDGSQASLKALGYFIQAWPLEFNNGLTEEAFNSKRQEVLAKSNQNVNDIFSPNSFDHCWVVEPTINSDYETKFVSKPHFLLTIIFVPKKDELEFEFSWNLEKIDKEAAKTITQSFMQYLDANPKESLIEHKAPLEEKTSLVSMWDQIVLKNKDKIAVSDHLGNQLTFGQLDQSANYLAAKLSIKSGETVGVFTTYSCAIPISFIAILKKGGVYVPLDPTVSDDRRQYIISDSKISLIISDIPNDFNVTQIHPIQPQPEKAFNDNRTNDKAPCYLIYTSGTTGKPKGCEVNHSNLINLFSGTRNTFNFQQGDNWILAHSYGFDFSTWEIWGSLLNAGTLYIPDRNEVKDTFKFHQILKDKRITILNQTPKSFNNLMLVDEEQNALSTLEYVIFGGDKLQPERIIDWKEKYPHTKLVNMYGITETTVHVTYKEVSTGGQSNIGKPLPGYRIELWNNKGQKVKKGFLGEMVVFGRGVCNGYFGKTDLTEKQFGTQGLFYKSGDLGWEIENEFYYLGRRDRQVKVRGFRIELGEIEFLLRKQLPQNDFVVLFEKDKLIAFYNGFKAEILPEKLLGKISDYCIPSEFIYVDKFPLNQSGKVDEGALLGNYSNNVGSHFQDQEQIFAEIFGSQVDLQKSFLQNGGDSIIAIRLIHRLKKEGKELTVEELFSQTPLALIEPRDIQIKKIEFRDKIKRFNLSIFNNFNSDCFYFPLLEAQEGILFDCLRNETEPIYVEQLTYKIPNKYTVREIQKAYLEVCQKNPILLSVVQKVNGKNYFFIDKLREPQVVLKNEKLSRLQLKSDFSQGLDLNQSLSRLSIYSTESFHELVWTHHHLILDGWSLSIFGQLMLSVLEGKSIPLEESFIEFACANDSNAKNEAYWKNRVQPTDEVLIPFLPSKEKTVEYRKANKHIEFNWEAVRGHSLTPNAYLLASWISFIGTLFSKKDIHFGNVVSLRDENKMNGLGMYVRTLPFDYSISHQHQDFSSFAQDIQRTFQKDNDHRNESINEFLNQTHLSHLFVFENYPINNQILNEKGVEIGTFEERTGAPWTTIVYPNENGVEISVLYETSKYDPNYVSKILDHYETWATNLSFDSIISEGTTFLRKEKILKGITIDHPSKNIIQILLKEGNNPAIIKGKEIINYSTLWKDVYELTSKLNLLMGQSVGIDVTTTSDFVISILATWVGGGVICPVDRRYPKERKKFIFENAAVSKIIESKGEKLEIKNGELNATQHSKNASFILHTSGSTGEPKGVVQTHDCLINLISWNIEEFGINSSDVILQLSSFGFDASIHEILLALAAGGTIVEVPQDDRLDIHKIKAQIISNNASIAWIPARLLNAVLEVSETFFEECVSLKKIVTTGEALFVGKELQKVLQTQDISLLNYYGPTETHVVSCNEVKGPCSTQPPIGTVISNTEIALYQNNEIQFEGLPAEMYVAGKNLAEGYLNDAQLTTNKFVFLEGKKYYKTGDYAYVDNHGLLNFVGRKDDQVKIRGFRVEPIEVENTLMKLKHVFGASVMFLENKLIAFIKTKLLPEEIGPMLANFLPNYMIPEVILSIPDIPLNNNGKVDRNRLKEIYQKSKTSKKQLDQNNVAVKCWIETLGHDLFEISDSFEQVGGNSILLMRMQTWLEKNENCIVTISELIHHNTPVLLGQLIQKKSQTTQQEYPEKLPLNHLQREILIFEIGNQNNLRSPFILTFHVKLNTAISKDVWVDKVRKLMKLEPYLSYVIDQSSEINASMLVRKTFEEEVLRPFSTQEIDNQPLIRFIHKNNNHVQISWHHLLLDGLGSSLILRRLIKLFEEEKIVKSSFQKEAYIFNPRHSRFKLISQTAELAKSEQKFDAVFIQRIKEYCVKNTLEQSTFWTFSVALAHHQENIAFTDTKDHPNIPGMFTNIQSLRVDLNPTNKLPNSEIDVLFNGDISVVVNIMYVENHPSWVKEVIISEPERTKYPYEWQIIESEDSLKVSLYYPKNDNIGSTIFAKWIGSIESIINGEPPEETTAISSSDIDNFDDFDF